MSGLGGIERQAKREFEREVLRQIGEQTAAGGSVSAELVEQGLGYYRQTEMGNPVQQVLGRRYRGAMVALRTEGLLAPDVARGQLALSDQGRTAYATKRDPWWRRLLGGASAS